MRDRARLLLPVLLVTALFAGLSPGTARSGSGDEVLVHKMKHRLAEELQGPVSAVLSETGRVQIDSRTNSLVIVDSPGHVAQARALLEAQDVRQRNIRITVETLTRSELDARRLDVDWAVRTGGWRIGTVPAYKEGFRARVTAEAARDSSERRAVQTVTVMNDGNADIATGHAVPYTDVLHGYAVGHGYTVASTRWVAVDTGFNVHARTLGSDRIWLEITPRMRNLSGGGAIAFTEASTQMEVPDGGSVILGSSSQQRDSALAEVLRGGRRAREDEETLLMVTAQSSP
jgi:type II secretory pathway component GspD/PulD (secretin)